MLSGAFRKIDKAEAEKLAASGQAVEWDEGNGWIVYDEIARQQFKKRPVAWRVKDLADGWILFADEDAAYRESERTGALMQGLYVRDGT